jgi:hypothetical protein
MALNINKDPLTGADLRGKKTAITGPAYGPATPAPSAAPKAIVEQPPTQQQAQNDYWNNLKAGKDYADKTFAEGSLGRLSDSYKERTDNYLDLLKGRLGGLDSAEMAAARGQAQSDVSREMAQNLEHQASIAGAQGIRGGVAASMQGQALSNANKQMADYQRQLILDNIAVKNQAAQNYGSALGSASDRALGVGQFNLGQKDAEAYGRASLPFQIAAGVSAQDAANWNKYFGAQQLGVAKGQVDAVNKLVSGAAPATNASSSSGQLDTGVGTYPDLKTVKKTSDGDFVDAKNGSKVDPSRAATYYDPNDQSVINPQTGQKIPAQDLVAGDYKINADGSISRAPQGFDPDSDSTTSNFIKEYHLDGSPAPKNGTIICTEARRQDLVDEAVFSSAKYDGLRYLSQSQMFAYWRWGSYVVNGMRRNKFFAGQIAKLVPPAIQEISRRVNGHGKATVRGWLLVELFDCLNKVFGLRLIKKLIFSVHRAQS